MVTLYVEIDQFYVDAWRVHHRLPSDRPLAILCDKKLIDLCREAAKRGLARGMSVAEAKAILPEIVLAAYEPETYRQAQQSWLDILMRASDIIEPHAPHQASVDLSAHPNPKTIAEKIVEELKNHGFVIKSGLAPAGWIAQLAATLPLDPLERLIGPPLRHVEDAAEFLAPLPTSSLLPAEPAQRERLEYLGYRWIGQVARAPLGALIAQFGDEGIRIQEAARGRAIVPVRALYPEKALFERTLFEPPAVNRDQIDQALNEMSQRLGKALREGDRQAPQTRMTLEFEEDAPLRLHRKWAKPAQNEAQILFGLRYLISPHLARPICGVLVCLPELEPVGARQQVFELRHEPHERKRRAELAVRVAQAAFGDTAIRLAADMPEPRRERVLRVWREATGWR